MVRVHHGAQPHGRPGCERKGPIALDGKIITNPDVQDAICSGQTVITVGSGQGAEEERTNLYNTLRFGALPVSLQEQGFDRVEPTLGANFLNQALIAGGIGLVLVLFFMIAYYRLPGVLAALALIFYALVSYAIFRLIGVTLTLAGVAAYILSIGMAVDANILIFERMKEEIRAGKTLVPAIEAGFNRAWSEHPRLERLFHPCRVLAVLAGDDRGARLRAGADRRCRRVHVQCGDGDADHAALRGADRLGPAPRAVSRGALTHV